MALDLSKLNFFKRLGARARIFVLLLVVVGFLVLVYVGTNMLAGGGATTVGPSRVASGPQVQSVPGGQLTAEYSRELQKQNTQFAQQAQMSGGSAIATLMRTNDQGGAGNCVICSDQNANVSNLLDNWVREGKVSPDVADDLQKLAGKNVSPEEYAAELDRLVKAGKLTPEQARQLLEEYRKQHTNAQLQDSAKMMDDLIKSGQLPIDAANELLATQKANMTPAQYAALLQRMVREGKISPEVAARLLAQYSKQYAKQITMQSIAVLNRMASQGQIQQDVLKDLTNLETQMVPLDAMDAALKKYVAAGKMIPAVSDKILDEYKRQKAAIGSTGAVDALAAQAQDAAINGINDLVKAGKLPADAGAALADMVHKNVSVEDYKNALDQLVKQGKLSPEDAKRLLDDYTKAKGLRDLSDKLANLQANNASPAQYADELKKAVQAGLITPEQAAQMMQEYQNMLASRTGGELTTGASTEAFAELQRRTQQGLATNQPTATASQFANVQTQAVQVNDQERQARLQNLISAMQGQAQNLISSWQPPTMALQGSWTDQPPAAEKGGSSGSSSGGTGGSSKSSAMQGTPIIKAGSILFAVLDTAINSDYPDSPVLATIVLGEYKGAKLLGKIVTTKGVSGQLDRVSLNFTIMNLDTWPKSKTVTAYAIDPDTARTVMASSVNYHYLQRFGAMFATSFLQGYATAITTSASTTTTGIFGTSTSHPSLSPSQKLAVALGQVGQSIGQATQNYINRPPTVRVDSGVSLGVLFMADVTTDVTS